MRSKDRVSLLFLKRPGLLYFAFLSLISCLSGCSRENDYGLNCPGADSTTQIQRRLRVGELYIDTIGARQWQSILLIERPEGMTLENAVIQWRPDSADTGVALVKVRAQLSDGAYLFENRVLEVRENSADEPVCPSFLRKDPAPVSSPEDLPEGYFLFGGALRRAGLFGSRIGEFLPFLVPNTDEDYPLGIDISDDGRWIVYYENKHKKLVLIRSDGRFKTEAPVSLDGINSSKSQQPCVGFLRDSPKGVEIYYLASATEIRAQEVSFSPDAAPSFGGNRTLVSLGDGWAFHANVVFGPCVVRDQIFGQIVRTTNEKTIDYTGFITIPNEGLGVAGPENIYQYSVELPSSAAGCAHAMSHDGLYAVANANKFGGDCVPKRHNGFYMVPFFRDTAVPVNPYKELIEEHGISINWCPEEYRHAGWTRVDWMGWHFTNTSDLLICRLGGREAVNGVWMCEWQSNTWFPLTPRDRHIVCSRPAAFIGEVESLLGDIETTSPAKYDSSGVVPIDSCDPGYEIIYPNSLDTLHIGDTLHIKVRSRISADAILFLSLDAGKTLYTLPTEDATIDPRTDSLFVFVIPDSVLACDKLISPVSDRCKVIVKDYVNCEFQDESDEFFAIAPESPVGIINRFGSGPSDEELFELLGR